MPPTQYDSIGIVVNWSKPEARPLALDLVQWLRDRGKEIHCDAEFAKHVDEGVPKGESIAEVAHNSDLVVVFGGDGTLLNVAGQMEATEAPIMGVKVGGLGFLTEIMEDEIYDTLEAILDGRHSSSERTMAEALVHQQPRGTLGPFPALNDVVFARSSPAKMAAFDAWADGRKLTRYLCDGLILATPTGSTAHSMAAGGPIIDPKADVFVLSPICPHSLTVRPIVINADTTVEFEVLTADAPVHLICDGQDVAALSEGDRVTVCRAKQRIRIVHSLTRDYYTILRTKLKWGER